MKWPGVWPGVNSPSAVRMQARYVSHCWWGRDPTSDKSMTWLKNAYISASFLDRYWSFYFYFLLLLNLFSREVGRGGRQGGRALTNGGRGPPWPPCSSAPGLEAEMMNRVQKQLRSTNGLMCFFLTAFSHTHTHTHTLERTPQVTSEEEMWVCVSSRSKDSQHLILHPVYGLCIKRMEVKP